jgi:3-isopropylmalate/(R)-2-methylmalate dehydratase small subunit
MIIEGSAVTIPGDNVDTDVLYPGAYLNIEDPEEMKNYLFDGYDPSLRDQLGGETIVVTGWNFGMGSSREHVPQAMRAWNVRCVVGKSFARIFRRNCVNLGLPVLECPEASDAAGAGSHIRIETDTGEVAVDGAVFHARPVAPFVLELQAAGGLVPWSARKLQGSSLVRRKAAE